MLRFVVGLALAAVFGALYAVASHLIPFIKLTMLVTIVAATLLYVAASFGAPRFSFVSHVYGLVVGAVAVWTLWVVWSGLVVAEGGFDAGEMLRVAQLSPQGWWDHVSGLSRQMSFVTDDFNVTGDNLLYFWAAESAALLLAALIGGHSGRKSIA